MHQVPLLLRLQHGQTTVEVVSTPTIFVRDPFMGLKWKKVGLVVDLREGQWERALPGRGSQGGRRGGGGDSPHQERNEGGCSSLEEGRPTQDLSLPSKKLRHVVWHVDVF